MTIEQFFNIYRPSSGKDRLVEVRVHQEPVFIHLEGGKYFNNKYLKQQIFHMSREWECPQGTVLPVEQMVPRDWRPLTDDLKTPPSLNETQRNEFKEMLCHERILRYNYGI
jgi:hypothetical protein